MRKAIRLKLKNDRVMDDKSGDDDRKKQIKTWLTKRVRELIPEMRRCIAKTTTGNF